MNRYELTVAEYEAAKKLAKENKHKQVDRRLKVVILRFEGKSYSEIAALTGYTRRSVIKNISQAKDVGVKEYARMKYKSNRRNLTVEEEAEVLEEAREKAARGEMITAKEIQGRLEEKLGREANNVYAYQVMERHGWRKVKPRPEHPKKASAEDIEASKKLMTKWMP